MKLSFVIPAGLALAIGVFPRPAAAQNDTQDRQRPVRWEIPGFDFRKDGAWRVRARQVAELRRQLLRQGRFETLNAPMRAGTPAPSSAAVTGVQLVPALLFSYQGIDSGTFMRDTAQYSALLFKSDPPPLGNPYTLRTYYEQMSNGLFSMQGKIMGWARLANTENTYTGTPGTCSGNPTGTTNCNGLFSSAAINAMQNGFREALARVDTGPAGTNFAQFDNDGPDLIPNTADDDGYVDMIMFAHATQDGSCGGSTNNHIWAHRFVLANSNQTGFQDYVTNDVSAKPGFGNIRVRDYFVQSALGGNVNGCDVNQIMAIGTAAHEFGHALGLPDLYDTQGPTEGIGRFGLMGSGNFSSPASPARMESWSLNELGWVTLVTADTTGTYSFGAAPTADTAFFVNVQGTNTRNEYFLVENRQASLADTALIRNACQVWFQQQNPSPCPGGLLLWHVDGTIMAGGGNALNAGSTHGLKLEEADGARDLWCPGAVPLECNRGDLGDVYPGMTGNTKFGFRTNPAATKNLDGSFVGFAIDAITQVVAGGTMSFRLQFGTLTVVRGSDSAAAISFDGANFNVFRDLLDDGSSHTVGVADTQLSASGRTRWRFASWSDGGARTHTITGALAGGTLVANLDRDFKLIATAGAGGTISSNPGVDLAGAFIAEGSPVELTATPDGGFSFDGWTGDTTSSNAVITLPMGRPYTVTATFSGPLTITSGSTRPDGVMGAAYDDTLRVTGGTGTNSWSVTGGALPQGVTVNASTGVLSGFPRETGNFSYQVTVASGSQNQSQTFTMSVTAPVLATADVVTQLLGPGTPLNADQVRYLDFLGNGNTIFDIGDFLAWVKATGAPLSAEVMARVLEHKGGRP